MNIEFYDPNNQLFIIRPILPSDKEFLRIGLKEMKAESVRQRFQSGKNDFTENELKYLTEVDQKTHMAFVAYHKASLTDLPAAVIRGVKDPNREFKLEIAITVIDQYQRSGLGLKLMNVMADWALLNQYTHFIGDLHNTNDKMVRLLQKFSKKYGAISMTHVGEGFLYFEVPLKK